jgi:endonuclease/exonuclease/phosphatase family metal-dependent hydrolase
MKPLRIMTFNIQALPSAAAAFEGISDDAPERAGKIADAIVAIPLDSQPDVIAFNEAFHDDVPKVLSDRLSAWPFMTPIIEDGLPKIDDAGVLLFSRFPFQPLATGGTFHSAVYDDSAGKDTLASKGVGIVSINAPVGKTIIAFTHLQAAYDSEDEYSDVRHNQFSTILHALGEVIGNNEFLWGNVILLGDFNVRGDAGATSMEWNSVFQDHPLFKKFLLDGWQTYMHVPSTVGPIDPGLTNIDYEKMTDGAALRQRLDYICFGRRSKFPRALVPHHMRVRLRNLSDHFALEALVQQHSQHCTPSEAVDFRTVVPVSNGPSEPSSIRSQQLFFAHEGSRQWLFVDQPGTYTVASSGNVAFELFLESDLSQTISEQATIPMNLFPDWMDPTVREAKTQPLGHTFACRGPFFICARAADGKKNITGTVTLIEHHGESEATAIRLQPHHTTPTSFPAGQPLGTEDKCWLKATMPLTFTGKARDETFEVSNLTGKEISVRLKGPMDFVPGPPTSGTHNPIRITTPAFGGETVDVIVERSSFDAVGFTVTWNSPVGFLGLDDPLYVHIDDETGVDRLGADEPTLEMWIDDVKVLRDHWDDADTGEVWPSLDAKIRAAVTKVLPGVSRVGFVSDIVVSFNEDDLIVPAHGDQIATITTILDDDISTAKAHHEKINISDAASDGTYSFGCTVYRDPA